MAAITKALRLTLRVKNNRLISAREMLGLKPSEAAERIGVGYNSLLALESLKQSPLGAKGSWSKLARRVAAFYGGTVDYFWPDAVMAVVEPVRVVEVDAMDAKKILSSRAIASLSDGANAENDLASRDAHRRLLETALRVLTSKELAAIKWRFGIDDEDELTLLQIGEKWGLSRERIRNLQETALAKLRRAYDGDDVFVGHVSVAPNLPRTGLSLCKFCSRGFRNSLPLHGVVIGQTFVRTCSKLCANEYINSRNAGRRYDSAEPTPAPSSGDDSNA